MGWLETCAVDERMRFVMAAVERDEAFAAVCRQFGVSRKTGYKWLDRYREGGVEGLLDRSRAPLHHLQAVTEEIGERCVAVRRDPRRAAFQPRSNLHRAPGFVQVSSIPPKCSVAEVIGYLKGKSSIWVAQNVERKERNFLGHKFWARGYFVSTVGRDEEMIRAYIRNQEMADKQLDQLQLKLASS